MCIICVKKANKPMVSDDRIRYMFQRNPDGAGMMWEENMEVHIKKGFMNVNSLLDFVHSRDWDNIPVILHFRIGTSGLMDEYNCHPYPIRKRNMIEGTCDLAVAHNGVLHQYTPERGSTINDTQVFIQKILNQLPKRFLENPAIHRLLETELNGNRLAFLSKSGAINRFGRWYEDENGYLYSNPYYKPAEPVKIPTYTYRGTYPAAPKKCTQMSFTSYVVKAPNCDDLSFGDRFEQESFDEWVMRYSKEEKEGIKEELDSVRLNTDEDMWISEDGHQEFVMDDEVHELYMYYY